MIESIEFKNVSFMYKTKYERIDIFENLNLKFQQNEFSAIMGSSGTGKSTLLSLIAGFLKPTSGEVLVNKKNVCKLSENEICSFRNENIGYIFQSFNLISNFNVKENIEIPLILSGVRGEELVNKSNELMKKFNLSHRERNFPEELSGGEQQRVAIARALANNPSIILADEPTGNLDKKNTESIMEILAQIHSDGKTILLVTHDNFVANLTRKIYNLEEIINAN